MTWKPIPPLTKNELSDFRQERKKTRFLIDESVDPIVTELLAMRGIKSEHVSDVGLSGHPDENILAHAKKRDLVLLTHDDDFLDDRKFPPQVNPGIVVLPGAEGDQEVLLNALNRVQLVIGDQRELWRSTKIKISADGTWAVSTFERDIGRVVKTRYRFMRGQPEVWVDNE